jgi:hypothetical protein
VARARGADESPPYRRSTLISQSAGLSFIPQSRDSCASFPRLSELRRTRNGLGNGAGSVDAYLYTVLGFSFSNSGIGTAGCRCFTLERFNFP